MGAKNKADPAPTPGFDKFIGKPTLENLLRKPAVQAFLAKQLGASDAVVRLGPGGTWNYNESKRAGVLDLNAALKALNAIASA